jgi:hypothetical protein
VRRHRSELRPHGSQVLGGDRLREEDAVRDPAGGGDGSRSADPREQGRRNREGCRELDVVGAVPSAVTGD